MSTTIQVLYHGKVIYNQLNSSKKTQLAQKCSETFEKITTQLKCPKCHGEESIVEYVPNYPGIDNYCIECKHPIEVKSIHAMGTKSGGYSPNGENTIKLGSPTTYAKVNMPKTLIVYWYSMNQPSPDHVILTINDAIMVSMSHLNADTCKTSIVYQKRKKTPKTVLTMLPKLRNYITDITPNDYSCSATCGYERSTVIDNVKDLLYFVQQTRRLNKKICKKRQRSTRCQLRKFVVSKKPRLSIL